LEVTSKSSKLSLLHLTGVRNWRTAIILEAANLYDPTAMNLQERHLGETKEQKRLAEARENGIPWRKWGPYLSERQWGTVREDYSRDGNAWDYFNHDQARSRAYHWGEDGLAGLSDDQQLLCFSMALWNGKDPILKERLFGLTNSEGNHGEDVKEYYFYLDNTPTHSYMKYLYKYPQHEFPYDDLVRTNKCRSRGESEYELLDTGVLDSDCYFDVFVEYAKANPEDILIRITVHNRGPEKAHLHLLPTLLFRNTWSWKEGSAKPSLRQVGAGAIVGFQAQLGDWTLRCEGNPDLLFTENESNAIRLWGQPNRSPYVKDAFHDYVISGKQDAVNPAKTGTKAAAHYRLEVPSGGRKVVRLRLSDQPTANAFSAFDQIVSARLADADEFYRVITPESASEDQARVVRQALAGMLWTKQYYAYDVYLWLQEHDAGPWRPGGNAARNSEWFHMINGNVISMPDKWEYPWYAAWDLAFHTMALSHADLDFAKEQLELMLGEFYLHPSGQLPAYEWNFSNVNPPVQAWAAIFLHQTQKALYGKADWDFLERCFGKLALNFTWWVNRKDRSGKNVFEGGFLGLDNIGVFDRSAQLPGAGHLEQADGSAWLAMFCQNMLEIAVELTSRDSTYEDMAMKYLDHLFWIANAINHIGPDGMWDDEDGFYYDVLRLPDGSAKRLKVRSIVGLLPLCATTVVEPWQRERVPRAESLYYERIERMPELAASMHPAGRGHYGVANRGIFALLNPDRLRRILTRMLDENEFLSPYGVRALSRYHAEHPYVVQVAGQDHRVKYLPAESDSDMFGGNSNWRGPVWMPLNVLLMRALLQFYMYYGDDFKIECPTGSGKVMNLFEVAREITHRLQRIFLKDRSGRRPVYGGTEKFQSDPLWKNYILFYEYFHGDNGSGLGASHQTGWTGLIAQLMEIFGRLDAQTFLEGGRSSVFVPHSSGQVAT
jgi:hypothetical protein